MLLGRQHSLILFFFLFSYNICFGESRITISGEHKFSAGDNLDWALPSYDDTGWQKIKIPGSWQSQGIKSDNGMGWYRIRFDARSLAGQRDLGVFLGKIGDADEVFFNGVKIGGEGVIDKGFVEATYKQRLYRIPQNLIMYGQENLLAVRVLNTYLGGGINESNIVMGNYNDLLADKMIYEQRRSDINTAFLTFYTVFFIFCVLMYLSGVRDSGYQAFTLVALIYLLGYLLSMDFFCELRSVIIQKMIFVLTSLLPASFMFFLKKAFREKFSLYDKVVLTLIILLSLIIVFPLSLKMHRFIVFLWSIFTLQVVFLSLYYLVKAIVRRHPEAYIYLIGVVFLSLGVIYWIAENFAVISPYDIYGFSFADFTMPVAMLCFVYAVDRRFAATVRTLKVFADKILVSQEEERKRISMDLHDGIGQSLMSIKLRLQMYDATIPAENTEGREAVKNIIQNVSSTIQELRDISMNIRPSFIENMSLSEIINWYGEQFARKTGIAVKTDVGSMTGQIPDKTKEGLFRIFQEALGNVMKHSGASLVKISLSQGSGFLLLSVEDNGKGFDLSEMNRKTGLGLYTMKERAELLGGFLEIDGIPEKGTVIKVRIPV